jgi:hypothetical protein
MRLTSATYRCQTAKAMKTAVFQISQRDGQARLVCVPMPSLHSAVNLEALLRMHADTATEIKFLGRFDSVQTASGKQEAEALILKGADRPLGQMITL